MHIEVDILRRQVTYHVYNAGCFIRLNRVSYPGYVVYIISDDTVDSNSSAATVPLLSSVYQ